MPLMAKEIHVLGSQQILSSMEIRWSVVNPPELMTPQALDLPIRTYTILCAR
jgi:hypothetical protein